MFYAKDFSFHFDNTSLCCLCVCISLPLITTMVVINFGLDCFTNSILAYYHTLFDYKLVLVICKLEV